MALDRATFHPLPDELPDTFGAIDVYLFDQVLRGRLPAGARVLDAGCGTGRNSAYFLRAGLDAYGVDLDPDAVREMRTLAGRLAPELPADHFQQASLDDLPFEDSRFDGIVAIAVLHFAEDDTAFDAMVDELWRVLRPGGMLFTRLASSIGIEDQIQVLAGRRAVIPDGTERYLVDVPLLESTTARLGGTFLDPIKTVLVHGQRSMTTWCIRKDAG